MSQVIFGGPYQSLSQDAVDEFLISKLEPIDVSIAESILESVPNEAPSDATIILETERYRFEQVFDENSIGIYCTQEWVERLGNGIVVFDAKTNARLQDLLVPEHFKGPDRAIVKAQVRNDKFFGLTEANRVLVWKISTGEFLEQIAIPHEQIEKIATTDNKLIIKTAKRYLATDI